MSWQLKQLLKHQAQSTCQKLESKSALTYSPESRGANSMGVHHTSINVTHVRYRLCTYVNHRTGKCCERHFYFRTGKCCEQTLMSKQPNDTCEQHFYLPSYIGMDCCSVQGPLHSAVWGLKSSTFLVNNEEDHWRPVNGWTKKELHHLLHQGLPAMILSGLFLPPTLWPKTESAVICIALHSQ